MLGAEDPFSGWERNTDASSLAETFTFSRTSQFFCCLYKPPLLLAVRPAEWRPQTFRTFSRVSKVIPKLCSQLHRQLYRASIGQPFLIKCLTKRLCRWRSNLRSRLKSSLHPISFLEASFSDFLFFLNGCFVRTSSVFFTFRLSLTLRASEHEGCRCGGGGHVKRVSSQKAFLI